MMEMVYVLTNEAMPGLIKIGRSADVLARLKQLDNTSLPLPYECHYAAQVDNAVEVERLLHQLFADHRVRPNREFFRLSPEKVVIALRLARHTDVTPRDGVFESVEEESAVKREKERRGRIHLAALGIPSGSALVFSRDEAVKCQTTQSNRILFEGSEQSLSGAALLVLQRMGYRTPTAQGSVYWMYEGETLDERRQRLEAEQFED